MTRDPVHLLRVDDRSIKQGMIMPLHYDQRVARTILRRNEPRQLRALARAADAQSLPLTQRVIRKTVMTSDFTSIDRDDRTRHARQIAREKIAKRPLADEANAGRILFSPCRNAFAPGKRAHVAFQPVP